ncbi:MAG: FHA domain-containing protein [Gammaproteobacteria bacterium]|nr:hypothetical protein [Gammaproteobacteria bacterium]
MNESQAGSANEGQHPLKLAPAPFADTNDDAFFFPSEQHLRALEFMGRALWASARAAVVIAEHGCGKSYLIGRLLRQIDPRLVIAAVQREQHTPRDFLLDVLHQFGITLDDHDRTDRRRLLERFLTHQAAVGRVCALIVENPQSMHPSVLEELRALTALESEGQSVLKVLLLGQPALDLVLTSPRMSEVFAGGIERFVLTPFSEDQTAAYIAHRMRAAGASDPDRLIPHTLMQRIHACTRGIPARINALCERALACAVVAGEDRIGARALDEAIERLGWQLPTSAAATAVDVAQPRARPSLGRLVVSMQGMPDREVPLTGKRMIIGRGEDADVRIDSVFVSRYHALIVRDGAQDLLIDLGSTNGVLVNARRITRRRLRHRDLIQVGPARVQYLNALAQSAETDAGETLCLPRPGLPPVAAGEQEPGSLIAFGHRAAPSSS